MSETEFKPYVPAETDLPEFTLRALLVGVILACVLGAANAYLGMKAGLTVAATFPAAVVSMAVLRTFRGSILEENLSRTTASVGEALVAGAIFTIPAFVISGVWQELRYFESTAIMLIGGVLGVLFVVVLRRTLVEEADLPFPESVATAEIVKAGQSGQTGAGYVFGAAGVAGLWELFKNSNGVTLMQSSMGKFFSFGASQIQLAGQTRPTTYGGGLYLQTPSASPALMGVGYIIGAKLSAIVFAGGVMGWLVLVPLALFLNLDLKNYVGDQVNWVAMASSVWSSQVRPLAVGAMIVSAFYTLYNLRTSLLQGIGKAIQDMRAAKGTAGTTNRLERDLPFKTVATFSGLMLIPLIILYYYFSRNLEGAIISGIVMAIAGFLFAAVAGYLVGLIGSSNNPISGLTLSTLIIAALLMVAIGLTGAHGIAAVLGVAGVVCCSAGIAGDMMQDLKVGHILGGTPEKMQKAEIIGVIVAALVLVLPLMLLHQTTPGGIGGPNLPAPQAGLMALMAKGIVGGDMPWSLVITGMMFAAFLILVGAPAPMLIAVGMYLPFNSTAAIFAGGIIRWILDASMAARQVAVSERDAKVNVGVLVASGLVAGEALMAVLLAIPVLLDLRLPTIAQNPWVAFLIYPIMIYMLVTIPLRSKGSAAVHLSH